MSDRPATTDNHQPDASPERPETGAGARSQFRPRPVDFVDVYLRIGWDGIEDHFRAHKATIKRWVEESGGDELKARRASAVKAGRLARATIHGRRPGPVTDGIAIAPEILAAAAHHLRHRQGGNWHVSPTGQGDWRVGSMRKTPAQLVEMAVGKGFDPSLAAMEARAQSDIVDRRSGMERSRGWMKGPK